MFLLQRESESSLQLIQSSFTSKSQARACTHTRKRQSDPIPPSAVLQESEDDEPVTTVTRLPRTRVLGLGGSVGVEGGIGEGVRGFIWETS